VAQTTFCATSNMASYVWSGPNEFAAATQCITIGTAGVYTVTITDSNGCQSTCSRTLTVNPQPICYILGNTTVCQGGSTTFSATLGMASYAWTGPNGYTATSQTITVSAPGVYKVTITSSQGCQSTCQQTLTNFTPPPCTITGSNVICGCTTMLPMTTFCATPGMANYYWTGPSGFTTNTPCIQISSAGLYTVTITDSNGCTNTCSQSLVILTPPTCSISGPSATCVGTPAHLCATSNMTGYAWVLGNTQIATTQCIDVSEPGDYTVVVTDSHGCTSTCDHLLAINPLPPCSITGTNMICGGLTAHLCATNGMASYAWTGPSNFTASAQCVDVGIGGTYTVTVTDSNGCQNSCQFMLTVIPKPNCTISASTNVICNGNSAVLCAPEGSLAYSWSGPNMYMAFSQCITVDVAGVYSVTVIGPDEVMADGSICGGCLASCQIAIDGCNTNICPVCTNVCPSCIIGIASNTACVASTNAYTVTSTVTNSTFSWVVYGNGEILGSTSSNVVDVVAGATGPLVLSVAVSANGRSDTCVTSLVVEACSPGPGISPTAVCVTRQPVWWQDRSSSSNATCATLLKAIEANGGKLDLGFVCLPAKPAGSKKTLAAVDALHQAESLLWASSNGKSLPAIRKQFAAQMIAAIANNVLLGTDPTTCLGGSASNLLAQARAAAACSNTNAIKTVTAQLAAFNNSGTGTALTSTGFSDCGANVKLAKKGLESVPSSFLTGTNFCAAGFACQGP
jgi:hypothetical protein